MTERRDRRRRMERSLTISLYVETYEALDAIATPRGVSLAQVARECIEAHLRRRAGRPDAPLEGPWNGRSR